MGVLDSVGFRISHFYESSKEWCKRKLAHVNEAPFFVLGNQKSGTTAIAALLAERTGLSVTLDLTTQYSALVVDIYQGNASVDALIEPNRLEFSRDIIKDPNLTFLYPSLCQRFPDGHFIMVLRDPRDNIRSILDRLSLPGDEETLQLTHHRQSLSDYDGMFQAWRIVLDSSWMGLEGETYIEMLADRWKKATEVCLQNRERIALIRYEDFLEDKLAAINDLAARLGLPNKNEIEHKVDEQFQPQGQRRGMDWKEFFGERNLARIESRCRREMEALGYSDYRVIS